MIKTFNTLSSSEVNAAVNDLLEAVQTLSQQSNPNNDISYAYVTGYLSTVIKSLVQAGPANKMKKALEHEIDMAKRLVKI
jgi:hypothetical protein